MKYKIGDKVRVKDNLKVGKIYFMSNTTEFDSVEQEMLKFKGKEVSYEKTVLEDGTIIFDITTSQIKQRCSFTEI
mgnify:CR=1 FL=1